VTGSRPVGFRCVNANGAADVLSTLQELEFIYHTNDCSRDEPFLTAVRDRPFVVLPYNVALSDRVAFEVRHLSTDQYACDLKNEFEMLYTEAEVRRRMMSISAHDYISGRPAWAKVLEEFIIHAQRRPGVIFLRKDEIARFALASPITPKHHETSKALEAA
jgi:hypothetical protein